MQLVANAKEVSVMRLASKLSLKSAARATMCFNLIVMITAQIFIIDYLYCVYSPGGVTIKENFSGSDKARETAC